MRCSLANYEFLCCSFKPFLSGSLGPGTSFFLSPHSFHFSLQIQVIEDDRNNRGSEPFVTGVRGQVPPLVTTNFLVKDQGENDINSSLWELLLQDYQLTGGAFVSL